MKTIVWILLLSFGNMSYAGSVGNSCAKYSEVTASKSKHCDCGADLDKKYPLLDESGFRQTGAPSSMSLVAVCDYSIKDDVHPYGTYLFRGNETLTGIVERQEYVCCGDSILFKNRLIRTPWIYGGRENKEKLKVPDISSKSPCWSADITLTITKFVDHVGSETDGGGAVILEFIANEVGEYVECVPEGAW